jgi:hypothetical protein
MSILVQILLWVLALYVLKDKLKLEPFQLNPIPENQSTSSGLSSNLLSQDFTIFTPPWLVFLVSNVVILGLLAGLWYWIKRKRKSTMIIRFLSKDAKNAIEELKSGAEFRSVVLRCYASMCEALDKRRNIHRQAAMTPREFQIHLLRLGLPKTPVEQITKLFEQVRYGNLPTNQEDEKEAIACLAAIVQAEERLD